LARIGGTSRAFSTPALTAVAEDGLPVGSRGGATSRARVLVGRWRAVARAPEGGSLKIQNFESRFIELAHMRLRKNFQ
jgi:hypothetical protein